MLLFFVVLTHRLATTPLQKGKSMKSYGVERCHVRGCECCDKYPKRAGKRVVRMAKRHERMKAKLEIAAELRQ